MTTDDQTAAAADGQPDPLTGGQPDYERMAAELMQQWQQQFANPAALGTVQQGLNQGATVAQEMLQMGQTLWQGWLAGQAPANQQQGGQTAPEGDKDVSAATAAAAPADDRPVGQPGTGNAGADSISYPAAASSLASVALCAELARRLDLLAIRVDQLERQLEQRLDQK